MHKSQSAMEYLMTYGWAILIIAVVLIALFQLGVFNGSNFTPKAQGNSCQVFRNSAGTSLEGQCNNQIPQYVAYFGTSTSNVMIQSTSPLSVTGPLTVAAWVDVAKSSPYGNHDSEILVKGTQSHTTTGYELDYGWGTDMYFWIGNSGNSYYVANSGISGDIGQFVFLAGTFDGNGHLSLYYNGQLIATNSIGGITSITETANALYIGGGAPGSYGTGTGGSMQGYISNVQIYNTSLSSNEILALYQEGIGGHPNDIENLVGWWPLNGNLNDSSGNNQNGAPGNIIYTGSWTSAYSVP